MDLQQRGNNAHHQPVAPVAPGHQAPMPQPSRPHRSKNSAIATMTTGVLLFSVAMLLLALAASVAFGRAGTSENKLIDKSKMQAVFLNGGQVYFGKLAELNGKYAYLIDIYYLRVNQQVQPDSTKATDSDVSLVKLGCELHGPTDEMTINRDQITFWENLKADAQVVQTVKKFKEQNPKGQDCSKTSAQTDAAPDAAAAAKKP